MTFALICVWIQCFLVVCCRDPVVEQLFYSGSGSLTHSFIHSLTLLLIRSVLRTIRILSLSFTITLMHCCTLENSTVQDFSIVPLLTCGAAVCAPRGLECFDPDSYTHGAVKKAWLAAKKCLLSWFPRDMRTLTTAPHDTLLAAGALPHAFN